MVDVARATKAIAKLTVLNFFPADPEGRTAIVQMLCEMATSNEQIDWVVSQMITWYNDWAGPREMRGVFCQRWKPASGPSVNDSKVFPEGVFPGCEAAAPPRNLMERPAARQLLQGVMRELPAAERPAKVERPAAQQIGQAEIDAAVAENRRKAQESKNAE